MNTSRRFYIAYRLLILGLLFAFFLFPGTFAFSAEAKFGPKELGELVSSGKPFALIDVRTPEEYEEGHIPGAANIPYEGIVEGIGKYVKSKSDMIVVYCRSGRRSAIAAESLKTAGYTNIRDIGAVSDWKGSLVKGKSPGKL